MAGDAFRGCRCATDARSSVLLRAGGVVGGRSDDELGARARARGRTWCRSIDLAGSTSLDSLAGVLRLASACVSNDSGAMHLAGAVGVPLAALFGPTRERETAPLAGAGGRTDVLINHVWCRPCMLRECPLDHRCMNGLSPDRVMRAVTDLMTDPESLSSGSRNPVPGPRS